MASTSNREAVSLVPESETRIVTYVDNRVSELDRKLGERLDKQDRAQERMLDKIDAVNTLWMAHVTGSDGHAGLISDLRNLKENLTESKEQPFKTWQWVLGAIMLLIALINLGFGIGYFIHMFVP